MESDMQIVVSQEQGRVPVTVFHIEGALAAHSYEQLEAQAKDSYAAGMRHLLIDLSGVTYMSSAGLRAIHAIFNMLQADVAGESEASVKKGLRDGTFKSSRLKLLKPSPDVRRVIQTMGFDMFLEIHDNFDKAVASF